MTILLSFSSHVRKLILIKYLIKHVYDYFKITEQLLSEGV